MQRTPHTNINKLLTYIIITICILFNLIIANKVIGAGTSPSGKQVSDIITDVRRQFNEYTAVFLADSADLLDWINYATYDIVSKTHCMQDTASIIFTSGATEYTWSGASPYITIKGAIYDNSRQIKGLLKTDLQTLGHVKNTGPPEYWYEWEDVVGVYPTPTSAYSGHTVYVYYIPEPDSYAGTGERIYTPAIYDGSIVNYCMYKALLKDRRPQEAANYLTEYTNTINQYRVDLVDKPKEPREVTSP